MSANFSSLVPQPHSQPRAHEKPAAQSINIIPLHMPTSSNGSLEEILPLHSEKTPTMDTSRSREIVMHSPNANIDGMLDITLHHASNIHNICIYGKQDVYAKFSITQTQDTVYSTQPVRGGGKNPVFNQSLQILISKLDAVLKCELWMMSCARNYLEDQLLGFVLVPLSDLMGMGKQTRDYTLTSTELFHTPAGTVSLSLMFYKRNAQLLLSTMVSDVSKLHVSENGMGSYAHSLEEDGNNADNMSGWNARTTTGKEDKGQTPVDYNSIEFPDLQVASENQQLVSIYMKMASSDSNMDDITSTRDGSQEQDGGSSVFPDPGHAMNDLEDVSQRHVHAGGDDPKSEMVEGDCEMALSNGDEENYAMSGGTSICASQKTDAVGNLPIIQTRGACASKEEMVDTMKSKAFNSPVCSSSSQAVPSPTSISSSLGLSSSDDKTMGSSDGQESISSFTDRPPALVSISLDPEVPVVQQQIVDMYMKSMQQFTESLAKMKLPFDTEGSTQSSGEQSREQPQSEKKHGVPEPVGKDGHRVFYGSRAFF
ncbi:hypothetical protein GOP47_0001109 [Adiantum capillus-veneris]|uniref:C2 domain-containing protein n=1 Tax=Adiantum capillus-veneris TaxID=13818 RepID=A0A9D4ZTP7_ADICA|nr:hypothetical protein GOP47_0001109 [Adiantum capillus-veneris]